LLHDRVPRLIVGAVQGDGVFIAAGLARFSASMSNLLAPLLQKEIAKP
jgi:hypothetical protein